MDSRSDRRSPAAPPPAAPETPGQQAAPAGGPTPDIGQLIADYHERIYRYAFRLSGSQADAEDLTQQAFLIAQQKLYQVRQPERIEPWLFAVTRNCFFKSRRKRAPVAAANLELEIEDVPEQMPDEEVDGERLQEALNQLSDAFRVVVLMFYFEQRSYTEIAAELNVPMGTVMSRLARAKRQLRQHLVQPDAERTETGADAAPRPSTRAHPASSRTSRATTE